MTCRSLKRESYEKGQQSGEFCLDLLMIAKYFERIGDHATNIAEWVICEYEGISRSQLLVFADEESRIVNIDSIISELASGRPVQYILGKSEFYGEVFDVGEGVLIPRPETEELVNWICNDITNGHQGAAAKTSKIKILDLCTGSGCIAISLANTIINTAAGNDNNAAYSTALSCDVLL